ncbi:ribosome maturation factor RimM [Ferrovum myxofaciens]|uniref:ribosome maturation factor RimM n=1 Tax=Ferrovum myxofaciens TaxID=416213 RepID=UPI000A622ACA|nr:ribosome maturation factor RimM [Ferrovum myxofaciens]
MSERKLSLPEWVVMGRIGTPFGVKGWVRVHTYSESLDSLSHYAEWGLGKEGQYQRYRLVDWQVQGGGLVASLEGVTDRSQAELLRGFEVVVPHRELPALEPGEFYWSDLVGMSVLNGAGETLGIVKELLETGAHPVLVVRSGERERLIPFVSPLLQEVRLAEGVIHVDWGLDY